jgi:diguanylate cyclase (GGDEF)-like protein
VSERLSATIAAGVTLAASLIVAVVVSSFVRDGARDAAGKQFDQSAEQTAFSVEGQVTNYLDELRDIGAFRLNSPIASDEEFAGFVEGTGIFEQLPSLVGVLWLDRVEQADEAEYLDRMKQAIPGFTEFYLGPREENVPRYYLVYYVPGQIDLELPVGAEISPITTLSDLMVASEANDGVSVVGSFQDDPLLRRIAEETDFPLIDSLRSIDFFIGQPSYPVGADPRTDPPQGWVAAPVDNFSDVLASASQGQPEDLGLSLTVDLGVASMEDRDDLSRLVEQPGSVGEREDAAFELVHPFEVDGVEWELAVWSEPDADADPIVVTIVLLGGIAVSVLAAGVVYLRVSSRQRELAFTASLADREHFQRDILTSVTNPMAVLDRDGRIVATNSAWRGLRALAQPDRDESAERDEGQRYYDTLRPSLRAGGTELNEGIEQVLDGEVDSVEIDVPIDEGQRHRWYAVRATPRRSQDGGAVVVHTDITERKRSHDEMALRATHDDLTGLLNRPAFETELATALAAARQQEADVAVLFIDLDGFKAVNDTYGHPVGDEVLRAVARRVQGVVRSSDQVGRLGGDEFVVLIGPLHDPATATATADRVIEVLREPVRTGGISMTIRASIGVGVVDATEVSAGEQVMALADQAMYTAKQQGGSRSHMAR